MRVLPISLWLLLAAQMEAQDQHPVVVRKMRPDGGEKFFPDYYNFAFGDDGQQQLFDSAGHRNTPRAALAARARFQEEEEDARLLAANTSALLVYRPPFAPHIGDKHEDDRNQDEIRRAGDGNEAIQAWAMFRRAAEALGRLERRQWACPNGTSSCSVIGYPNSCCQNGETCVQVTNTGLGNVGCCPAGATCGGLVGSCPDGDTSCDLSQGGGCCIAGYQCQGIGCVLSPTSVETLTTTSTSIYEASAGITTMVVTTVITVTPTDAIATITGGLSGDGAVPPLRPTSSTPAELSTYCPTGFYACSASAGGGCCQTGRDCATAACPSQTYTTVVTAGGVTVVVPVPTVTEAVVTSSCATGWFLCGPAAGDEAGCCPSGYSCGTASCSRATIGGTATLAKELPGSASRVRLDVLAMIPFGLLAWVLWA